MKAWLGLENPLSGWVTNIASALVVAVGKKPQSLATWTFPWATDWSFGKWSKRKQGRSCLWWPKLESDILSLLQILLAMHIVPSDCRKWLYKGMNTRRRRPLGLSWRQVTTMRFHRSRRLEPKLLLSNAHVILIFNSVSKGVEWGGGQGAINIQNLKALGIHPTRGSALPSLLHCLITIFPESNLSLQ